MSGATDTAAPLWQRMGLPAPDVVSPGPWTGDDKGNVRDAEGRLVAQLMRHADMDAVLALPAFLKALHWIDSCGDCNTVGNIVKVVRDALAEAKGAKS